MRFGQRGMAHWVLSEDFTMSLFSKLFGGKPPARDAGVSANEIPKVIQQL